MFPFHLKTHYAFGTLYVYGYWFLRLKYPCFVFFFCCSSRTNYSPLHFIITKIYLFLIKSNILYLIIFHLSLFIISIYECIKYIYIKIKYIFFSFWYPYVCIYMFYIFFKKINYALDKFSRGYIVNGQDSWICSHIQICGGCVLMDEFMWLWLCNCDCLWKCFCGQGLGCLHE